MKKGSVSTNTSWKKDARSVLMFSTLVLVVVSLVTKPPAADHVDRFFLEARNA